MTWVPVSELRAVIAVLLWACTRVHRLGQRADGPFHPIEATELESLAHTGHWILRWAVGDVAGQATAREILATFDPEFRFGNEDELLAVYDASLARAHRRGEPRDGDLASVPFDRDGVRRTLDEVARALTGIANVAESSLAEGEPPPPDGPAAARRLAEEALKRLHPLRRALAPNVPRPATDDAPAEAPAAAPPAPRPRSFVARRCRVGVLGARPGDREPLLRVLQALGCDGHFVEAPANGTGTPDGPAPDLFVALHQPAAHAAAGSPLPAYAPVVCVFRDGLETTPAALDELDVTAVVDVPVAPFAPTLRCVVGTSLEEMRPTIEDGLALARYMSDHPDDAAPEGRHFEPGDRTDLLYVGDDADVLELLDRVFKSRCPDGRFRGYVQVSRALAAFDERTPDILWTNQSMPEMNGDELLRLLRPRTRHRIPTVLDSGGMDRPWRVFAPDVGASAFVAQPFGIWALGVTLRNAARLRRALRGYASAAT